LRQYLRTDIGISFLSSTMVSVEYHLSEPRRSSCLSTSLGSAKILIIWCWYKPVRAPCYKIRHTRVWVGEGNAWTVYNRSIWQEQSTFDNTIASLIHSVGQNCPRGNRVMTDVFCATSWLITTQRLVMHHNGNHNTNTSTLDGIQSKSLNDQRALSVLNNASNFASVSVPE